MLWSFFWPQYEALVMWIENNLISLYMWNWSILHCKFVTPIQITWPWPKVGTFSHELIHGGDTSLPKQFQNGGPQAIYETLHIEYRIVCYTETYVIHIYHMSKCSKCNWNRYIEGFCIWNMHFQINGLSPNIAYVILMSWPLMAIYLLL